MLRAALLPLALVAAAAWGAGTSDRSWLQPADGAANLALELRPGLARVWSTAGGASSVRLRRDERLLAVAELADGWVAAGARSMREGQDVFLLVRAGGRARRAELPSALAATPWRTRAVPIVDGARLAGAAWLEGAEGRPVLVRAAGLTSEGWEEPVTVAWPTGGSQTGLAAAALADGTWLLVWSRFDGEDDELFWSERRAGVWSPPRAVTAGNAEPDLTPSLLAQSGGSALLAWSRLVAGDYRTLVARFGEAGWSAPREVSGPGGLGPRFVGQDSVPYLVLRDAALPGWAVLELDETGAVVRRAAVASADASRPRLLLTSGAPASLQLAAGEAVPLAWEVLP